MSGEAGVREGAVPGAGWLEANHRYLVAELDRLRRRLQGEPPGGAPAMAIPAGVATPLDTLALAFGLSGFERDVLLLCAGVEFDAGFRDAVRRAGEGGGPTFGLALALAGGEGEWSALNPASPLRRWHLVEVEGGEGVASAPLRIPERVLHHLAGLQAPAPELAGRRRPVRGSPGALVPSQAAVARAAGRRLEEGGAPVVQLVAADAVAAGAVAVEAAGGLGLALHRTGAHLLPRDPGELERLARLWEREAALEGSVLLVDAGPPVQGDEGVRRAVALFLELLEVPVLVWAPDRIELRDRYTVVLELPRPSPAEQGALWRGALGPGAAGLNGAVERVVAHFDLDARAILGVARSLEAHGEAGGALSEALLWETCRAESRSGLDGLAHRIEPRARWDDLVLPELQLQTLRTLAAHVRNRATVLHGWGFERHASRGHGVSALFAGPSGTGKTLAAEVVAGELGLDLHLIDLSQVVNKYIGETEKNLSRVFDAAERGGAVLLFDEADALFGKRSEVKDSHDRYANIEVSYLLQRMESYRGLAILTTNQKGALDDAFLRRIRFVVSFPFPGPAQRAEIWRRAFPADTPTRGVDPERLARLNVSGGHIRNIALNAAFLAADADEPVGMPHLLAAARLEYAKLEKPFTDADAGGWR